MSLGSGTVADGAGRYCTRNDFLAWIELVSSSLPTPTADHRFDNLVRACWGLPAEAANRYSAHTTGDGGDGLPSEHPPLHV